MTKEHRRVWRLCRTTGWYPILRIAVETTTLGVVVSVVRHHQGDNDDIADICPH
jgi:hypothetical protein